MHADDVIIIGGGVIGCALAWRLARGGARVRLIERERPGAEASSAAAGILIPAAAPDVPAPLLEHWLTALHLYPTFVASLQGETGMPFEYRTSGRLVVALTEAGMTALGASHTRQVAAGVPAELWSAEKVRAAEPSVASTVVGGLFYPEHGLVDNRRLVQCLAIAATRRGAIIQTGRPVTGYLADGERVVGVDVCGERYWAASVVNAAGSWAGLVDARFPLPIVPAKGQILALETRPVLSERIISSPEVSLIPRTDGRLIVGATVEDAGYDKRVTAGAVQRLLGGAINCCPMLAEATLVEVWAGLRPVAPTDRLPVIGADLRPGLFHATGHYTMGVLSAPATAEAMAELITTGRSIL